MEARNVKFPLGSASLIEAQTFGQPGRRTFRLVVQSGSAQGSIWLEKEQLFQLGVYLQEAIRRLSDEEKQRAREPSEPQWSGGDTSIEFKARQLLLNHDQENHSFQLQAYEDEPADPEADASSVSFWMGLNQAEALAQESIRICAAGRPPCFLCGLPINPDGHVCPKANGHAVLESG